MRPKAYEGNEKYIFVSYSHKDTEQAFQVMESLQKEGYRVWYDDGIVPGSEWPENIAQHLNNAAMVMALITPNSMESHNCRREINFALAKMKPFLSVVLEPTEMSLGMEMQLSAQHNILRYNYKKWDDFIQKILSCPDIEPCKETDETEVPVQVESKPVEIPKVEPVPVAKVPVIEQPQKKEKNQKAPKIKKEKTKKPVKKILAIAAAVIVLVAVVLIIPSATSVDMSWGDTISKSETSVYVYQKTVTQADLDAIADLDDLIWLKFENCEFADCDFSGLHLDSLLLQELTFENCTGVNDFAFINELALEGLNLNGCSEFTDLSALDYTNLRVLEISDTGVSDLSCLEGLELERLYFDRTGVTDISALGSMTNLSYVSGSGCNIASIDVLAGLERLNTIRFSNCPIQTADVTFNSLRLEYLILEGCELTDISGFRDATMLKGLNLQSNPNLTDMTWMDVQNYETLTELYLGGTGLTVESIAFVADCGNLQYLDINGIQMPDLTVCQGKTQLQTLYASNCGLTDISALSGCESLETVILSFNQIEDVTPLSGMMEIGYGELDLSFNALTDVSGLGSGDLDVLILHGNEEDVAMTIPSGLTAFRITADWFDGVENSSLSNQGDYVYLYLLDCPNNQKLMLEETLGSGYVHFIDQQQLIELIQNQEIFSYPAVDYAYQLALYESI